MQLSGASQQRLTSPRALSMDYINQVSHPADPPGGTLISAPSVCNGVCVLPKTYADVCKQKSVATATDSAPYGQKHYC